MELAKSDRNPLINVILLVCVLNLLATFYIVITLQTGGATATAGGMTPLPPDLDSRGERTELFERFMPIYNSKDYTRLYELLDEIVQVQYTLEEITQSVNKMYTIAGTIHRGAYSHCETQLGGPEGTYFNLHYLVATEKGDADLTISVLHQIDEPSRIVGYHISSK